MSAANLRISMEYDWTGVRTQRIWRLKLAAFSAATTAVAVFPIWAYLS
jgi:hypothetical protein